MVTFNHNNLWRNKENSVTYLNMHIKKKRRVNSHAMAVRSWRYHKIANNIQL